MSDGSTTPNTLFFIFIFFILGYSEMTLLVKSVDGERHFVLAV